MSRTGYSLVASTMIFSGLLLFCIGILIVLNSANSSDVTANRNIHNGIASSGSNNLQTKNSSKPSVKISKNGKTCWLFVPSDRIEGVSAIDASGKEFQINTGDYIEMELSGKANIGRGSVGPEGESGYGDRSIDGPFHDRVGGLEFSVGPLSANRYLASVNRSFQSRHTGVPVFRVIESRSGYMDGNHGGFSVKIIKK